MKDELGFTGPQMAESFGVAGGQQWRKYTGGAAPRQMSPHMLFFGVARLESSSEQLARIVERMRQVGAEIGLAAADAASSP